MEIKKLLILTFLIKFLFSYDSGWTDGNIKKISFGGKEIFEEIKNVISLANKNIDIEVFEFNNFDISKMLVDKMKKGVNVRVILEKSDENENMKKYLRSNGISAVYYPSKEKQIDHVKLIIVDKKIAILGGANLGIHSPYNFDVAITLEGNVVSILQEIFDHDWGISTAKKVSLDKKFNKGNFRILTDDDIESYLKLLIKNARKEIDIAMYIFTDDNIFRLLNIAKEKGVIVRVVLDPNEINSKIERKLNSRKIPFRKYPINIETKEKFHIKLAIIDEYVIFGSANFSFSGLNLNHECNIVIKEQNIVKKFKDEFNNIWKKSK